MNELLTQQLNIVKMNEIKISTNDYPIIGTEGLGPCISFILHNKDYKRTIVGHLSTDIFLNEQSMIDIVLKIYYLIKENNLKNTNFDLYLIPGAIPSKQKIYLYDYDIVSSDDINEYSTIEVLEILIKNIKSIKLNNIIKEKLPNNALQIVDLEGNITDENNLEVSLQYAFDSRTGEFVTDRVFKNNIKKLVLAF